MKMLKNSPASLAIVAALVLAFAFTPTKRLSFDYAIGAETATQWTLVEKLNGQTPGIDYECDQDVTATCSVTSNINHTSFPVIVSKSSNYQILTDEARFDTSVD